MAAGADYDETCNRIKFYDEISSVSRALTTKHSAESIVRDIVGTGRSARA